MWKRSEDKILSQRVIRWLRDNPNFSVPDELVPELIRITTDDSNNVRHSRFGASSRGDCLRMQVFKYLGVDAIELSDPALSNIFLDGTWRHIRWQMIGAAQGWFTRVEVKATDPERRLAVSADAINDDEGWGFELKGTSQLDRVIKTGVPEKHLLQVHTMMDVFDLDTWVYMAEDKSSQEIHEVVVRRNEKLMTAVKEEISALNESIDSRRLPEVLPACRGGDGRTFQRCPFRHVCLNVDSASIPDWQWDDPAGVAAGA